MKTAKTLLKQLDKCKENITKERNKMRKLLEEVISYDEVFSEGLEAIEEGIDKISELVQEGIGFYSLNEKIHND